MYKKEIFRNLDKKYIKEANISYDNAKADAIFGYASIKKYLKTSITFIKESYKYISHGNTI